MAQFSEKEVVDKVVNSSWEYMDYLRMFMMRSDGIECCVYLLFCTRHHIAWQAESAENLHQALTQEQYELYRELNEKFESAHAHFGQIGRMKALLRAEDFVNSLRLYPSEYFDRAYDEVISQLFISHAKLSGRSAGEFAQPEELTKVVTHILRKSDVHSIYNPFSGLASYSRVDRLCKYIGQDISHDICTYARVSIDSREMPYAIIENVDALRCWRTEHFDAVVATPPFGLHLMHDYNYLPCDDVMTNNRSVEGYLFIRALLANHAKTVVAVVPTGISFSSRYYELRKYLVKNNYLDTIIQLPDRIMFGTGISVQIIICKSNREANAPIRLIDASSKFIMGGKKTFTNVLDAEAIISLYDHTDNELCYSISSQEIVSNDYNLSINLYSPVAPLKEGDMMVRLNDVLLPIKGKNDVPSDAKIIDSSITSHDFISVLKNENVVVEKSDHTIDFNKFYQSKEKLLVIMNRYNIQVAIHSDDSPFVVAKGARVFSVNTELITPEYLAYKLVTNPDFAIEYAGPRFTLSLISSAPIVIPNDTKKQARIVAKIKQEYIAKQQQEQAADAARLGLKHNVSDLGHMLAPTIFRMDNIVSVIEGLVPDDEESKGIVKSLHDNLAYMNRIITNSASNINPSSFNFTATDMSKFLVDYASAWGNFGTRYFQLQLQDQLDGAQVRPFDPTMMMVLMDAILTNAGRHSFKQHQSVDNLVRISVSPVMYQGQQYACLRVSNNGEAFADGFTIQDYISRGRYDESTGRSGLGGYHVYAITKAHNGFLNITQDDEWNVIIEVLLPLESSNGENITEYENECV